MGWHSFDQSLARSLQGRLITDETALIFCAHKNKMRRDIEMVKKLRDRTFDEPSGLRMEVEPERESLVRRVNSNTAKKLKRIQRTKPPPEFENEGTLSESLGPQSSTERDFRAELKSETAHAAQRDHRIRRAAGDASRRRRRKTRRAAHPQSRARPARDHQSRIGEPELPPAKSEPSLVPAASTCDVLYIEDDLVNFTLVERILEFRPALKLLHARRGETGVELAQIASPEVDPVGSESAGHAWLGSARDVAKQSRDSPIAGRGVERRCDAEPDRAVADGRGAKLPDQAFRHRSVPRGRRRDGGRTSSAASRS